MPRTAGVSSRVRWLFSLPRPRPRTVARCDSLQPIGLLTSLTVTVFLASVMLAPGGSVEDFFNRLATLGGDFRGGRRTLQGVERGADHVVGVRGAVALGDDVV